MGVHPRFLSVSWLWKESADLTFTVSSNMEGGGLRSRLLLFLDKKQKGLWTRCFRISLLSLRWLQNQVLHIVLMTLTTTLVRGILLSAKPPFLLSTCPKHLCQHHLQKVWPAPLMCRLISSTMLMCDWHRGDAGFIWSFWSDGCKQLHSWTQI